MNPTITFDYRAFNAALNRRLTEWGEDCKDVIKQEAQLLTRNCIGLTPPITGSPKEDVTSWAKQKKAGENAIAGDLLGRTSGYKTVGIFMPITASLMQKFSVAAGNTKSRPEAFQKVVKVFIKKDGTIYATEKELYEPGASLKTMQEHHKKYLRANGRVTQAGTKTRDIGRWKFVDKMVITKSAFSAFLKYLKDRVGFAKAGWMPAANRLGVKGIPKWISRHSAPGTAMVQLNTNFPSITIENAVPYAQRHNRTAHIIQRALNLSAENLVKRLNGRMNSNFKKR